jgi:delta1-piperideine-2-carboxylate reductase
MHLTIADARALVERVMEALGHDAADARLIADHLIDCELRGLHYGGLPRALSIAEQIKRRGKRPQPIRILRETPVSARLDGGDQVGYLVAHQATRLAVAKALAAGIAVIGASNTWYTGMLSYYAEMAADDGLVCLIASHTAPWVAPQGASEGRFGTNPICFGFPSAEAPVIWDIGTAAIIHAQATLAARLGEALPEGVAFDAAGRPTRDPIAALGGAFAAWGGHKGSGLGLMVQLLGGLAGAPLVPEGLEQFGFFILALRPDLLNDPEAFKAGVAQYASFVREARPVDAGCSVRMPFDRSREERRQRLRQNTIDIEQTLYTALLEIADRR